jgi:hypothetical protein
MGRIYNLLSISVSWTTYIYIYIYIYILLGKCGPYVFVDEIGRQYLALILGNFEATVIGFLGMELEG